MKTRIALLIVITSMNLVAGEPQQEAETIQKLWQEPGEGVVVAAISGQTSTFGTAGATREGGPRPDKNTIFEIGSVTKAFTAILLAETVREGKVSLTDPVTKFLPKQAVGGADTPLHGISLIALATHTSGLPRDATNYSYDERLNFDSRRLYSFLRKLLPDELVDPGQYSNIGFALLGHLLERVWDKPYHELVAERIFQPLGMDSSFVLFVDAKNPPHLTERQATGHKEGKPVSSWIQNVCCPTGSIVSSADDMMRFAQAHWNPETPAGLAGSLKMAAQARFPGQGLGWGVEENGVLRHGGLTGGFQTDFWIQPSEKKAGLVLRNSSSSNTQSKPKGDFSGIAGFWLGTLKTPDQNLRIVHYITEAGRVVHFSIDQGAYYTFSGRTKVGEDGDFTFVFPGNQGAHIGKVEGDRMFGTWHQSGEDELNMERVPEIPAALKRGLNQRFSGDLAPLAGYWSGYIRGRGNSLFVYRRIEDIGGAFLVDGFSPTQTTRPTIVDRLSFDGNKIEMNCANINGSYEGTLDEEKSMINGTWTQWGVVYSLNLKWSAEIPSKGEQ